MNLEYSGNNLRTTITVTSEGGKDSCHVEYMLKKKKEYFILKVFSLKLLIYVTSNM